MKHFLPKKENCFCRLYILNYALRQVMGVTGHRYGCQHCFLLGLLSLHVYTATFRVAAIHVYKIGLPFKLVLA